MNERPAVLILGGTAEAVALAEKASARFDVTYSLAGRTRAPALPGDVATRSGGFGGAAALARWIEQNDIHAVIDATHPFADRIARHAAAACTRTGIPRLKLVRPAWERQDGDDWRMAENAADAARLVPETGRRAFLSIGRQELDAFAGLAETEPVVRSIDPPEDGDAVPGATYIAGRGPFTVADETAVLRRHAIDVVVSRNAGGDSTYAKIAAARALGLPVVMIARPQSPPGECAETVADALDWLDRAAG